MLKRFRASGPRPSQVRMTAPIARVVRVCERERGKCLEISSQGYIRRIVRDTLEVYPLNQTDQRKPRLVRGCLLLRSLDHAITNFPTKSHHVTLCSNHRRLVP